ncbi:MAG: ferritin-like domain-containing protein [Solirubrobacteraceae bacterium]|nr:ferritin-like domain-containing protein [Solirubrobacteraceae bacterium]
MTAAGLLGPAAARAQLPAPAPQEDDIAFLSFAAVAERASRDVYRAALRQRGAGLSARERRHLSRVASAKRAHIQRLDRALGEEAPGADDFVTVLPDGAVTTRARALALAERLETLLVRVYLNGVGYAADPATRLLLGRLLAYDAQAVTWLRVAAGKASPAGLQTPIDLEAAGEALEGFLSTPDFQDDE